MDGKRLWRVIGDVYDAALDSSRWPDVLGDAAAFVGGSSAALYWKDAASKAGGVHHDDGRMDLAYQRLYFEKYAALDPATHTHVFAGIDEPIATADFSIPDEYRNTRIYREWLRPQGIVDGVNTVLDKTATGAGMFIVFRFERDGIVDDETRRRMRLLAPHVRRAVHVGRMTERKEAEAATYAGALDGLSAGPFFVDPDGAIIHANAAGRELLETGDLLRIRGGRLAASRPAADIAFRKTFHLARSGDEAVGTKGISLPLDTIDGDQQHVMHILPLTSGERRKTVAGSSAVAALFVHKVAIEPRSAPEIIARHYSLTPMELRVLLAIVDVGGVPESAEALGVAQTTVKWHLGHLFQKTGTSRQADLVKLVAGFSSPLLS
jgi:DNA-binding CsgD family transcriptional regulator/PAS domain-containing protein